MSSRKVQGVEERSSTTPAISFSFGEIEAMLARLNDIDETKRIAFQGRLKHFLKLGLLPGVKLGRGRAAAYGASDAVSLAIALDFTDLGLLPEIVVRLLSEGRIVALHIAGAVKSLARRDWQKAKAEDQQQPLSYFVGVVPQALGPLVNDTTFVGVMSGTGGIQTTRRKWSNLNLSALLDDMADAFGDRGHDFLHELDRWLEEDPIAKRGKTLREDVDWARSIRADLDLEGK